MHWPKKTMRDELDRDRHRDLPQKPVEGCGLQVTEVAEGAAETLGSGCMSWCGP